jgi:hypothetical protein
MYPSVMSPIPDLSLAARPVWPRDTNGLTQAIAEMILAQRGLLTRPPPD